MSWLEWWLWGGLLVVQNASFTLVSRARNSNSLVYHACAAVGSNGIWFASQFILLGNMLGIIKSGSWADALMVGGWYTLWTIVGSVGMHWLALHKIERKHGLRTS